mmetsp:Transcript_83858/g.132488  ORF Transcript_83858/g.132488 Transcript_83858/m.132488 type:complete len:84 (-) Transcript_83858:171-422(-)
MLTIPLTKVGIREHRVVTVAAFDNTNTIKTMEHAPEVLMRMGVVEKDTRRDIMHSSSSPEDTTINNVRGSCVANPTDRTKALS